MLVGNKLSPGNPAVKADGTVVHTLWGELAWQLGFAAGGVTEARKAYDQVRADDEKATSPGDALRTLFKTYGPCLILIDEWVAYARQLHDQGDLPGGSFETQFTFAQALTESAKLAQKCLLVISLPASDTAGSPTRAPTTPKWAVNAVARRWSGCATWWGASNRRGGRPAPRKASRSCAVVSSSR